MNWQEEFMQLYTSGNSKDFNKALEIKREHLPTKLYRYRSVTDENIKHRLDEIVAGNLFLSHPKDLNDPFEIRSMLHSTKPSAYFHKDTFISLFEGKIPQEEFERIFSGEDFLEALAEYVAQNSGSPDKVKELQAEILKIYMDGIAKVTSDKDDLLRAMTRLACFSTTSTNLPMWHHYANSHAGICLEFDTSQIKDIYQINRLFPVYYVDKLPDVTHMMFRDEEPTFAIPEFQAIHKLKDWNYEKEWRLIYNSGSFYYSHKDVPDKFWTQGKVIKFIRPSRIILGMNISANHEEVICDSANQYNIPVTKAKCTEFGIKTE